MSARDFRLVAYEQSEHELQIDCTNMLRILLLPDVQWTAIDHAHSFDRTIGRHGKPIGLLEAVKRKERGIKAGPPDYLFWHKACSYAIELKAGDGTLDPDQRIFLRGLIAAGVECKVCWTKDQVFNTVVGWGLCRRTTAMP